MKKFLIIGGVVIGTLLLARRFVKCGECDGEKETERILERLGETRRPEAGERAGTAA